VRTYLLLLAGFGGKGDCISNDGKGDGMTRRRGDEEALKL
jgi:hypothetical protein